MTLSLDCTDQFLAWWSANGGSDHTIRAYASDLANLSDFALDDKLDETIAAAWLNRDRLTLSPTTIRRRLATLRSFAKWQGHPTFLINYRAPVPNLPEPHPIDAGMDGVRLMLNTARPNPGRMALVALTGFVGLRVGTACRIGVENIDLMANKVTFVSKGNRWHRLPLSTAALEALTPALEVGASPLVQVGERRARELITQLGERAGLGHVASHDMRSTFLTTAYEASGYNLRAVQELAGHVSSFTTQVYTKVSDEQKRAVVEAVGAA